MRKGNNCYKIAEDGLNRRRSARLVGTCLLENLHVQHSYSWIRIFPQLAFFSFPPQMRQRRFKLSQ